jgi:hypothetical protein
MGPVVAEVTMRPGDVMYLRSFTPHRVSTRSPCSLHVSFDLCDSQPSAEIAVKLLLEHYDRDSSPRYVPPREVLDKLLRLSRSASFEAHLKQVGSSEKAGFVDFRRPIAQNRVTHLDRYIEKSDAPRV